MNRFYRLGNHLNVTQLVANARLRAAALLFSVLSPAASATVIVLDLGGVVARPVTVSERTASGPTLAFDFTGFFAQTMQTSTVIAAGTPFSGRFRFDLDAIPAAHDVGQNLAASPLASFFSPNSQSHFSAAASPQWVSAALTIGGFSFSTTAQDSDAPTSTDPNTSVSVSSPLEYGGTLLYGNDRLSPSDVQLYATSSSVNTAFQTTGFDAQGRATEFGAFQRTGSLDVFLSRSLVNFGAGGAAPFLDLATGIPTMFSWNDQIVSNEPNGFFPDFGSVLGFFSNFSLLSALDSAGVAQTTGTRSSANFEFGDLLLDRALAAIEVPMPATVALLMLGLAGILRRAGYGSSERS
jgi:hypothetical protein